MMVPQDAGGRKLKLPNLKLRLYTYGQPGALQKQRGTLHGRATMDNGVSMAEQSHGLQAIATTGERGMA
jgi:hypothetical protein